MARNILFIMCDQLRHDYLGCTGHPHLTTPHLDALAADGTLFTRAYVQSPICGPSRMSTYTGRYVRSHGSLMNGYPLRLGEMTLGDYLRPLGVDTVLVGKTHMRPDREAMERYGLDPDTVIGARLSECGFDAFERDDGLHPDRGYAPSPAYNRDLTAKGYAGANPWHSATNSTDAGSGWFLRNADRPAKVAEADSETPYLTRRFMDFIDSRTDDTPWCCHLSFIKPHWPYVVPAPYHAMFGPDTWLRPVRAEQERADPHPVYKAFMDLRVSRAFARDEVRNTVLPAYMGLIKQIDDQMGLLFAFLRELGLWDDTLIVFTSDHGDYLGDHWLGEKDLFHDPAVKVPLIIRDPDAGAMRGQVCDALVEAIDLAPTFNAFYDGPDQSHRMEGRSLLPLLCGERPDWRKVAFSEYDYAHLPGRAELGRGQRDAKLIMACDARWKMIHCDGFPPMLFDLQTDPDELHDLGRDPATVAVRDRLTTAIFDWTRRERQRVTVSDADVARNTDRGDVAAGILIGFADPDELAAYLTEDD